MRNRKRKKIIGRCLLTIGLCLICMWRAGRNVEAGLTGNPYITFSPDGNAFTTNADETDTVWHELGYTVNLGQQSSLRPLQEGEHLYDCIKKESVPVGKWVVHHKEGSCIHGRYPEDNYFYGVNFTKNNCFRNYYSGWMAYCADCGQRVVSNLFYMSEEAAASINTLDMTLAYYYRCPWCYNLEQGTELKQHICKAISYNQYSVRYHANFGKGYMPKSVHMYNNASVYEGQEVSPQTRLTRNSYTRLGYEFTGWNTKADGTGVGYSDGQEIYNLCSREQESITLYAQWKKSQSVLWVDPNGGSYLGTSASSPISGVYGSTYALFAQDLTPPAGAMVHFDTNGGAAIPDMTGEQEFAEWSFQLPMQGTFSENVYTYKAADGAEDHVKAVYRRKEILLPEPYRAGFSFGGWYYDREGTRPAGTAGTMFLPTQDLILYACWVDLRLTAENSLIANGGKGAVNLAWEQKDDRKKTYRIYQKQETGQWQQIHTAEDVSSQKKIRKVWEYTGCPGTYIIPYTGFYQLTLRGAQGTDCLAFSGGAGGEVKAVIYFEQGDVLTYTVGGQNGYHGGGLATAYGDGGGCTSVSTVDKGLLLVAGGGGGATAQNNGGPGGSQLGNMSGPESGRPMADGTGQQGGTGMAGGGGGYQGGAGGEVITHRHTDSCRHVHSGNPSVYGGCYTVAENCGNTTFREEIYKETFYYGNEDEEGNHRFCVRCGSDECPGHHDIYYEYICTFCNTSYKNHEPGKCTALKKYNVGCGRTQDYVCGYVDNQIIGSTPAYGGSNYGKEGVCISYQSTSGVQYGNGSLVIEALHIGFREENFINGVKATDYAPPEKVEKNMVKIKPVAEDKVNVTFARPLDKGTTYYHYAESYSTTDGSLISTSNQTANTLVSGIQGYRYVLDNHPDTAVTDQHTLYRESGSQPYIGVKVTGAKQYLHIAAQDKAGNLSETTHIPISSDEIIFWPVITEPITIKEGDNVFASENVYFVKADGTTPFTLSFQSRLLGTAQKAYQINRLFFRSRDWWGGTRAGGLTIEAPMENDLGAGSHTYGNPVLHRQYEESFLLQEAAHTRVCRRDYCRQLDISQAFTLTPDQDGMQIRVVPGAGIVNGQTTVFSEEEQDLENSIYLRVDGTGPEITGLDLPDRLPGAGETEYMLELRAADSGSGVKFFWVEITNPDNGSYEKVWDADKDGLIRLPLSTAKSLFWGRFSMQAYAADQVGNESLVSSSMDGLTVTAYIEKTMPPQTNVYKKGEAGMLQIQTTGYAERVEVIFPREWTELMPGLDRQFVYDGSEFLQKERVAFMIPLQVPEGGYQIQVKAYKEDMQVEAAPELLAIEVSGSILEELRTRLR